MIDPIDSHLARRLRELRRERNVTADGLAVTARRLGLGWSRSTVSAIETGVRGLSARELVALPVVFAAIDEGTGRPPVTIDDLYPVRQTAPPRHPVAGATEVEYRIARQLGVTVDQLDRLCRRLWGRNLVDERDRRVTEGPRPLTARSLQARRGHATRTMLTELRNAAP